MSVKLTEMFVFILFSSLIIVGLSTVIGDVGSNYSQEQANLSYISRSNETVEAVEGFQETISNTPFSDVPLLGGGLTIISGVDAVLRIVPTFVSTYTSFVSDVAEALGVPSWMAIIFNGAVVLLFVFALIAAILRWDV